MAQLDELQQQLGEIKTAVRQLTTRVGALEARPLPVNQLPTVVQSPTVTGKPRTRSVTVNPAARWATAIGGFVALFLGGLGGWLVFLGFLALLFAIVWPWRKKVAVVPASPASAAPSPTAAGVPKPAAPRQPSRFEQDLAKHWFSWLGIISLVVGVTLLINYAFRGLGPIGRVLTGYATAGMLFGLWFWLRKMYRGFAFILQGGAWAIVYVSTYAMHVIAGRPLESAASAGILLLSVVAIIAVAALLQRSKTLTAGAFFLGYVTAFTNEVDLFTLTALLTLSLGVVAVASAERWVELVMAGTVATYAVQLAWMTSQGNLQSVAAIAAGFLVLEVLIFGAAHWLMIPSSERHRRLTMVGSVLNLVGFYWLFRIVIAATSNSSGWLATLFIGLVCALLAGATMLAPSRRFLRPVYIVFAVGFFTLALGQRLDGDSLTIAYLIESTAVVCLGAIMNERTLRYSGYLVSFVALLSLLSVMAALPSTFGATTLHTRLVLGLFGALLMALNAAVLRSRREVLPPLERYASVVFADVAIGLAVVTAGQELPPAWVPVVWSLGALGLLTVGTAMKSFNARGVSYMISLFAAGYWLTNVANTTVLAGFLNVHARVLAGLWVVAMLALAAFVLRLRAANLSEDEKGMSAAHAWAAVIMLTIVLGAEVAPRLLSIAWGIEGVALYSIGFALQSVQARRQGLMLLVLTIGKVYIVDVRTLTAPYRILSFIILGVILLVIGFLYNRWRQRVKPTDHPAHGAA